MVTTSEVFMAYVVVFVLFFGLAVFLFKKNS